MTYRFFLVPDGDSWTAAKARRGQDGWLVLYAGNETPEEMAEIPASWHEALPPIVA